MIARFFPAADDTRRLSRLLMAGAATALLAGCDDPLDFDLRGNFGDAHSTAQAARQAVADRPPADDRGVISYPGYQVAVAERGDTVQDVARRIGTDAGALARYNGLQPDDTLRKGEIIALPSRVSEPSPETGAAGTGPLQAPGQVDITTLAGNAIDRSTPAPSDQDSAPAESGTEPVRHQVKRGETAFTISRLYNVSVRSLADWNGLSSDFGLREGQYLLIPVADTPATTREAAAAPATTTTPLDTPTPGSGSPTPTPPSATRPLPEDDTAAATPVEPDEPAPDMGESQTSASDTDSRLGYPVQGKIVRDYAKGRNDGIDIQASAGTEIKAAASGTVAAITSDADQIPIVVIKHPDNLLTVYANVEGITVAKGDSVSRGQSIAKIRGGDSNYVHFEVRKGFDSVDPNPYLN